jgi:tripartite-type tricarboxylate transporter receptor subunit TctC
LPSEARPSSPATIGIGRVSRAKPDGYTIAFSVSSSTHVFNPAIYSLSYDVINDFEPIGLVTKDGGQLIVAKKSTPANVLNELIAWMRANPGGATIESTLHIIVAVRDYGIGACCAGVTGLRTI